MWCSGEGLDFYSIMIGWILCVVHWLKQVIVNLFLQRSLDDVHDFVVDHDDLDSFIFNRSSDRLVIYLHGLNGSPNRAVPFFRRLRDKYADADIIAPIILHRGNCSSRTAAKPIIDLVNRYIDEHPTNPIVLICYSNGSRIGSVVENSIPDQIDVTFVSIAGIHHGTKLMDYLDLFRLTRLFNLNRMVVDEFKWDSLVMKPRRSTSSCHFIATPTDERVFPLRTSMPLVTVSNRVKYHIIDNCSHVSILDPALEIVLGII
jgi:hypothetical protein